MERGALGVVTQHEHLQVRGSKTADGKEVILFARRSLPR
jgi:hypothetical protein